MHLACVDESPKHVALGHRSEQHFPFPLEHHDTWLEFKTEVNLNAVWCELDMHDHRDASTALDTDGERLCRSNVSRDTFRSSRCKVKPCKLACWIHATMSPKCRTKALQQTQETFVAQTKATAQVLRVFGHSVAAHRRRCRPLIPAHGLPLPE